MPLTRRQALGGLAVVGAGAAFLGTSMTRGPKSPEDPRWLRVRDQTRAFRKAAARRGFAGSWDGAPKRPTFAILPPATGTEIARTESQIGRALPKSLRSFFLDCTAGIDVSWLLPGRRVDAPWGGVEVKYDLVPPRPFSDEKGSPLINSGGVSIRLDKIPDLWTGREMWRRSFLEAAARERDDAGRAHYEVYARFWERGFPIATNGGGDVVAIDMEDPEERLFLAFHDGSDEPGWLLGQDLLDHLDQQSRLGFPDFEIYILPLFKNEAWSAETFKSFEAGYPDRETVRRFELAPVGAVAIDAEGPNGLAWRKWVGLEA